MANRFQILTREDVYRLPDVRTGFEILKEWNIPTTGLKDKKSIQDALLRHLQNRDTHQEVTDEVSYALKDAIENSKRSRDGLIERYEKMLGLYRGLPPNHQSSLNKVFPYLEDTAYRKIKELKSNECAILVAGESVAGKSSFVNLLVGVELLPTSQLPCTATFCELRYSTSKYAVCYTKDGRKRKIDLSEQNGIDELKQRMTYTTDDVDDNENEKILVFWPFDILEEGIVIIDTPGIGTSKEMTDRIQQYLTNAFGCIYVINSASAGGVQKGRIVDFLRAVMALSGEQFNPQTTMFVCNKWEKVPAKDREETIKSNNYKLRQCYPDFREDQVYYLSTDTAKQAMQQGVLLQDHKTVLRGIYQLLPASLENKYEAYYRWLSTVVKRMQFIVKVSKHARKEDIENLKAQIQSIEKQMYNLQQNASTSIKRLQVEVQKEADSLQYQIINLLSSPDIHGKVKMWDLSQCPGTDRKWKKVSGAASELIAQRLTQLINEWERNNRVKAGIKDKIIGRFRKDFELMEDQIKDIEGQFLGDETRILADLQKTIRGPRNKKDKTKGKGDNQRLLGIGGIVAVLGTLGKESRDVFKKYKKDTAQTKMADATDLFLQNILRSKDLKDNLQKFVQRYSKGIDKIAELIPDFLEADRQIIADLKLEAQQTQTEIDPTYLSKCVALQGDLDLFYVDLMMHVDYKMSDIDCRWDDRLGQGSFADVFFGILKTGNDEKLDVALKRSKDEIKPSTITDILLEDRTMRDIKHENIITYYGNALYQARKKTYWVMIMECCIGSLKNVLIDTDSELKVTNPANCDTVEELEKAERNIAVFGEQLCNGLDFLHSKKMVHRDLKPENVLLTRQRVVKLTDVGLTKPEVDISGTITGSPVYMGPEVLNSTGVYDRTADIYSLGIMIWEMWYGIDAAEHIGPRLVQSIEIDVVKRQLRPSLTIHRKPDDKWRSLMESCWSADINKRPQARDVKHFFRRIVTS